MPINLDNWKSLDPSLQSDLTWWHQYCRDHRFTREEMAESLGYDWSTCFRVLKGTYEGSWKNIQEAIKSYRRLSGERAGIQRQEFVETPITRLIFAGLDYSLANNSIVLITGESRMGKTASARAWRDRNNHGRSVFVTAPAFGGTKALLKDIAESVGVNKNLNALQMHGSILRAFNRNRMLILDEAHRLLPPDRRSRATNIEILRDVHDRTGCALALLSTQRFDTELKASEYMYEQLIGRIGMPIRLPRRLEAPAFEPILRQFIARPTQKLLAMAEEIANAHGRLGILVETLRVASRMASKAQKTDRPKMTEEVIFQAMALRKQMQGEQIYAAKN